MKSRRHGLRFSLVAIAAVTLFDCIGAGPSLAAPPPPPPVSVQQNWTGFYLGGNVGMRSSQANWDLIDYFGIASIPGASAQSFNDAGFRGGFYFGYNWQLAPRWVAGVEADAGWGDKTTTQEGFLPGASGVFFSVLPGDFTSVRTTWDASLRARLGYLVTPSVLIYGTGGVAWQHYKFESTCGVFDCGTASTGAADVTRTGWTLGGGIEVPIARNWLARGEYRYADFGTARVRLDYPAPISDTTYQNIKLATNTFQFGLAYRLDPTNRSDMLNREPMWPAPGKSGWNGVYVGVSAGARSSQAAWTTTDFSSFGSLVPGTNDESFNDTTFKGGLYGGYNWQFAPRWIAGVEGDWGSANKTTTQIGFLPGLSGVYRSISPGDSVSVKTTWDSSLRARLGFLATPSLLVYGTGGIAWLHYEIASVCGTNTCIAEFTSTGAKTAQGWTVGGGLEAAIMGDWRARAEYRYADFGTSQHLLNVAGPVSVPATVDIKLQTHTVMFGLGYIFN